MLSSRTNRTKGSPWNADVCRKRASRSFVTDSSSAVLTETSNLTVVCAGWEKQSSASWVSWAFRTVSTVCCEYFNTLFMPCGEQTFIVYFSAAEMLGCDCRLRHVSSVSTDTLSLCGSYL